VDQSISRRRSLALTSLAHFINDGTVFFVPVIAAIVASHGNVSAAVVTLIFFTFYGTSTLLSLFVGRLSDRLGRPASLMGLGLAILSLGLLAFYLALAETSGTALVVMLLLAAAVTGAGSSFYHPLGASVLQSTFRGRSMGTALGVNGALGSLGRALYPSLYFAAAVLIAGYGSIALFAAVGLAAAVAISLGVRVPKTAATPGPAATPGTGHASVTPTPDAPDAPPGGALPRPSAVATAGPIGGDPGTAPRPRDALTRGILILTVVAFLRSSATQGIASWIPTYLATQKGLGTSGNLGLAVSTMYAAAIIGQPVFGLLVDRFDKRAVLALSSTGAAVTTIGYLALGPGWLGEAWLFAFGFFVFSGFPLLLSMVGDYVPRGGSSLANALVWGIGSTAGGIVGPLITGGLIGTDYGRLGFAFVVLAVASLLSAGATVLIPPAAHASRMRAFG
jgi:MFS family permease